MNNIAISTGCNVGINSDEWRQAFVDVVIGICGAGKSYEYSKHINNTPSARFIVAAKTDALCEQIHQGLPGSVIINTDNINTRTKDGQKAVTMAVCKAVKSYKHRVIVVTHKALELLSMRLHYDDELRCALLDYQAIVDEAPDSRKPVSVAVELALKDVYPWLPHTIITNNQMYATRIDKLREVLKGRDTRNANLLIALINGDRVKAEEIDGKLLLKSNARSDLYMLSRVCKVVFVGADMMNSPIIRTGLRNGYIDKAQESPDIRVDPSRNMHHNTGRVNISALLDVQASKRSIKKHCQDIADKVKREFGNSGKPFLFTCNADESGDEGFMFETFFRSQLEPVGGIYIPPKAQGLNSYQHITNAAWLCSVRFRPDFKAEFDDVDEANHKEAWENLDGCYQFLARTVIRNQDDKSTECKFLVLDEQQREYCINNYFPDAHSIKGFEPVHVETISQQERGKRKRSKTLDVIQTAYDLLKESGMKATQKAVAELAGVSEKTVKRSWAEVV